MSEQHSDDDLDASLGQLLTALLAQQDADQASMLKNYEEFSCVKQAVKNLEEQNLDEFYYFFVYPLKKISQAVVANVYPKNTRAQFICLEHGFVQSHFRNWIEKIEGSACCADKARYILALLLRHFTHGTEITFNKEAKYTFHHSQLAFTTQEHIVDFFEGLYALHVGRPEKYLVQTMRLSALLHRPE